MAEDENPEGAREPSVQFAQSPDVSASDFRGSYGFGRPAHRADPGASYVFRPNESRVLPVNKKCRWR